MWCGLEEGSQNGFHCLKGKNILFDIYKFSQQYTHYMQYSRHDEISIGYFEEKLFRNLGQKIIPDFKMGHCQPQYVVQIQ